MLFHTIPDPSLYVYESVELELSLTTPSLDSDEPTEDDFTCPIRLHRGVYLRIYFKFMTILLFIHLLVVVSGNHIVHTVYHRSDNNCTFI